MKGSVKLYSYANLAIGAAYVIVPIVTGFASGIMSIVFIALGAIHLAPAIGFMKEEEWAKMATFVLSGIMLFLLSIGIIIMIFKGAETLGPLAKFSGGIRSIILGLAGAVFFFTPFIVYYISKFFILNSDDK